MRLTIEQISDILGIRPMSGGFADGDDETRRMAADVSMPLTDSRSLFDPARTIFFAITTSSNDGHRYVRDLYRRGVRNFVMSCDMLDNLSVFDDANVFYTDVPVTDALQQTAAAIRSMVSCPVIGITGSRGKTVVKEMLARAFDDRRVTSSPRSWNSQIGVPLSVWRLEPDTGLGIFEAGISRPGEMERLERIIRPTLGVFTGLTDEHSREFDTPASKCREKARLFTGCTHIIYIDNDPLVEPTLRSECPGATLYRAADYTDIVTIARRLLDYRGETQVDDVSVSTRIDFNNGQEEIVYAYDRYSNDLGGVETALDLFTRRVPQGMPVCVILGDIELRGLPADEAYRRLEHLLLGHNVDGIIAVGHEIGRYAGRFSKTMRVSTVPDPYSFVDKFNEYTFPHTALLIKGKPGHDFDRIAKALGRAWHYTSLEVNLDALIHNFNHYRSLVKPTTGMIGMVKADAYGAGAVEVSRTLQSQGADYLAVAVVDEGLTLRRAGISMPIMVLNPITDNYNALFDKRLEPTVFSLQELRVLSCFAPRNDGTPYPIHVKLDTGMHRFGLAETELPGFIDEIREYPQFRVATIFSHLATADCTDMDDYTRYQLANFDRMSQYLIDRLGYPVRRHVLNTAGITRFPEWQYDLVRLGIGLYGISPLGDTDSALQPVSSLVTTVSALQQRRPGETVGYGRRGVITEPSTIATLGIGYADGLNRHLGNGNTRMWVDGAECPTVGNICMDICMIDVTGTNAICTDRVEIFGPHIPVERVARALDTIPYEVLTSVSPRVKRVYFRE